ncbi:NAD(P)(+)--arginine ADP-ribosyltransferase 2-like [Malurus melanocephalus]|uniref:NAD(P)(+)--arginine ADP-ribosyltransferase 2-like n=1 Tax=Malurus melanocephalus TaxID=175006 RepID=UPI002547F919|nr:NAD(P)(+)--arginine ADP-ribosyltransferase 2-like [Malurus melanocephalus]
MAPLAPILALLAMSMATVAIEVVPMDMAPNAFDDRYQGCRDKMAAMLPVLKSVEFQQNSLFAPAWAQATAEWQNRGSPVSPLLFPDQAIAIMAYTMSTTFSEKFLDAVHEAGHSRQQYRDNFHFKTLHFLLTDALAKLKDNQCRDVYRVGHNTRLEAQRGQRVRFGWFLWMSLSDAVPTEYESGTLLQVHTCHGVDIRKFSFNPRTQMVLTPPYEIFEVTQASQDGDKTQIQLRSTGTHSNYTCEWLRGGSSPRDTPMLRGLLLATAALAVATGIF